jgi:hypothetical protein
MNGWNRVFVVVAVVWTLVAPFLFVSESNKPADALYSSCSHNVYELYGTGSSKTVDMDRYRAEGAICLQAYSRRFLSLPATFSAMVGLGDWTLGGAAWGFILIPLALLWIVVWGIARIVLWIIAGFRQRPT